MAVQKEFTVQCGTIIEVIYSGSPKAIITALSGRNSVNAQGITAEGGREKIVFGGGTTTAQDIKKIEERWDQVRMEEAISLGLQMEFKGTSEEFRKTAIKRAIQSLKEEYPKPPITLS